MEKKVVVSPAADGLSAKFKLIPVLRLIYWYLSFVIPICEVAD